MEPLTKAVDTTSSIIVTNGAGIVSLSLIFIAIIYIVYKIPPLFKALIANQSTSNEVIRTNSECMREVAKSNENVSRTLDLITPLFNENLKLLEEHDKRAQLMSIEINKISERTSACRTRNTDK